MTDTERLVVLAHRLDGVVGSFANDFAAVTANSAIVEEKLHFRPGS